MRNLLARRPDAIFFLVAGYFALAFVMRVARPGALGADDTEQALLSQFLLWGYGKQPPFYNWLQYGLSDLIGLSVVSITLLKNLLLFVFCALYGLAARVVIANRSLATIAMLGVLTMPPVFLLAQRDLSHTVAALVAVSLFLYAFWQILKEPSFAAYALAGVAIGIGILSKYNFVILPLAAVVAVLPDRQWRRRLFDPRMLVAILIPAAMVAPHAFWFLLHRSEITGGTLAEMKDGAEGTHWPPFVLGVFSLATAAVFAAAPTLAAFALIFRRDLKSIFVARDRWTAVAGRMFVASIVLVLLVVIGVGATHIREKWLVLFVALLPIYLALKVQAAGVETSWRLGEMTILVAAITVGTLLIVHGGVLALHLMGRESRHTIPYEALATKLRSEGRLPTLLISMDTSLGANLKVNLPPMLVLNAGMPFALPALSEQQKANTVLVWSDPATPEPPAILTDFAASLGVGTKLADVRQLDIPVQGSKPARFYSFAYGRIGNEP